MFKLKSCQRCKGDVLIDRDQYGLYEQCLQCGYQRDLEDTDEVQQKTKPENVIANVVAKETAQS